MSPLSPGTKENVQLNMKEFGQPSVKRDYTNSFGCRIVNPLHPDFAINYEKVTWGEVIRMAPVGIDCHLIV
jgi:hypothetical protein